MSEKVSIALKTRWAKMPLASKAKIMRKTALSGWAKLTPEQRTARAKKAARTRLKKKTK